MIRRLLHALGLHWWSQWYRVNTDHWPSDATVDFERRFCVICAAEERQVVEA